MGPRKVTEQLNSAERDLLIRAQSSADGFAELFDRYYDRIYAYAYRRIGTSAVAEDIAACVFEDALRNIKRVRWQGKPVVAWLYRIASRRVADHYRDRQNSAVGEDAVGEQEWRDIAESPDAMVERAEAFETVRAGLDKLVVRDREIIQLTYFDQASVAEIAAMWNCTSNSVYVRLHRALKRLRAILEEDDGME
jgi:RNA polymerase sigma-70 factor (ECF subfamily)